MERAYNPGSWRVAHLPAGAGQQPPPAAAVQGALQPIVVGFRAPAIEPQLLVFQPLFDQQLFVVAGGTKPLGPRLFGET